MYNYPNRGQEPVYFNEERIPSQSLLEEIRKEHLNKEGKTSLLHVIKIYRNIFYQRGIDLTFTNEIKHEIKTKRIEPIYTKTKKEEMFSQAIIRCSTPPYSSPTWIVPIKILASDKRQWRVAVDYRKLNEITVDDKFPKPNIDDILDKLGRSIYFTTLCLAKVFQQVKVKVQMPIGLKNAPATLQNLMICRLRGNILFCLNG